MNKPKWNDAPEWAKWLARDYNGDWFWYENEPYSSIRLWNVSEGKTMMVRKKLSNWQDTLEPKPSCEVNEPEKPS